MDLKEIERIVAKVQSSLFKNSNSYSIGMLKSHFKGAGIQFKEHQIYVPGDDIRFIDWKLLAKYQTPFVKTFEEERNIEICVVMDITQSMFVGSNNKLKIDIAYEVCFLLFLLADKTKDFISVVLIYDQVYRIPPKRGKAGMVNFVSKLKSLGLMDSTDHHSLSNQDDPIHTRLKVIRELLARRKQVIYLTDLDVYEGDYTEIEKLINRENMHCFVLKSPIEEGRAGRFSFFVNRSGQKYLVSGEQISKLPKMRGKHKELFTDSRYLEDFIKEML